MKVKLEDNKTLYIGKYPITIKEYSFFCKEKGYSLPLGNDSMKLKMPIVNIDWNSAKEYCEWLSNKNDKFRLLFFEEWIKISKMINIDSQIRNNQKRLMEVDAMNSDNLGLFHFHDNIHEWCYDSTEKIRLALGGTFISIKQPIKKLPTKPSHLIGFRILKESN